MPPKDTAIKYLKKNQKLIYGKRSKKMCKNKKQYSPIKTKNKQSIRWQVSI